MTDLDSETGKSGVSAPEHAMRRLVIEQMDNFVGDPRARTRDQIAKSLPPAERAKFNECAADANYVLGVAASL